MIYGKDKLSAAILSGDITVESILHLHIEPASIDLRLASEWLFPRPNAAALDISRDPIGGCLDTAEPIEYHAIVANEIIIPAHGFVLARTHEYIKLSAAITGWIEGRSSFGRAGLFVQNAGWIDPGFEGTLTLELYNANPYPAKLYAGTRCCQLIIADVEGNTDAYNGTYQGQVEPKGSKLYKSVREALDGK